MLNSKTLIARSLAIFLLIGCLTTACQTSPQNNIVQGQKGKMFEIIDQSEANEDLIIPDSYAKTIISNNQEVEVIVRAQVSAAKAASYPVYTLKPMDISNEYAAKIMNALFGDKELYALPVYGGDLTYGKDFLGYAINVLKTDMEKAAEKNSKKFYKDLLNKFQSMYADAPESMYTMPALKTFSPLVDQNALLHLEQNWKDGKITDEDEYLKAKAACEDAVQHNSANNLSIEGIVDLGNGMQGDLKINKTRDNKNNFVQYHKTDFEDFVKMQIGFKSTINIADSSNDLTISEAAAISIANQLISDMGIDYMGLSEIRLKDIMGRTAYGLTYYREMKGTKPAGLEGNQSDLLSYRASWKQESINLRVNDEGVSYFKWTSPSEAVETKTDCVKMLDFNEIMNIFEQQILVNQAYGSEDREFVTKRQLVIEKITLNTMTVPQPNKQNEYIAIPVWDFEGYQVITYSDDYQNHVKEHGGYQLDEHNQRNVKVDGQSFLTINAIDGSIIDRALGY